MTTKRPEDYPTVEPDEDAAEPEIEPGEDLDLVRSGNGAVTQSVPPGEQDSRPSPMPRSGSDDAGSLDEASLDAQTGHDESGPNGERPETDASEPDSAPPESEWQPVVGQPVPAAAVSAGTLPPWQRTYGSIDADTETIDGHATRSAPAEADAEAADGVDVDTPSSPLPGLSAQTATAPPDASPDAPADAPPDTPAQPTAPVPPVPPVGGSGPTTGPWPIARGRGRPPRQASLQLKRLDPWSVLKLALVLAAVTFFVWLVTVGVLYGVLDGMGVWDRLNGTYSDLVSPAEAGGGVLISAGRVFGAAAIIGVINSVLLAVAMTVGAFVYNVAADLVGGIELTLSERD